MADQDTKQQDTTQGGFPDKQTGGQDIYSTTGDGHPPRPGEKRDESDPSGKDSSQEDTEGQAPGRMSGADRSSAGEQTAGGALGTSNVQNTLGGGMGSGGTGVSGMGGEGTGGGRMGAGTSSRTFEDAENM